jgi:putative ABC transport system substrate-binding protein
MQRREFITLAGGAAAWPFAVRAQQPTKAVIGYLSARSPGNSSDIIAAFRQGLNEVGFAEGRSLTIEFRFAEGNFDQLPALAAELAARNVDVLVATGGTVTVVKVKPVVPRTVPIVLRWVATRSNSVLSQASTGPATTSRALPSW